MLTRRKLIMGAVATALAGLGATPALARDERLLADILYGVSDALVRDYIRDRYEDGRWDGLRRAPLHAARVRPLLGGGISPPSAEEAQEAQEAASASPRLGR